MLIVLTLPSAEINLPCHPSDTIGLFVQMIVVSLCSVFLIAVVALSSKTKKKRREEKMSKDGPEDEPILMSEMERLYK